MTSRRGQNATGEERTLTLLYFPAGRLYVTGMPIRKVLRKLGDVAPQVRNSDVIPYLYSSLLFFTPLSFFCASRENLASSNWRASFGDYVIARSPLSRDNWLNAVLLDIIQMWKRKRSIGLIETRMTRHISRKAIE